MQVFNLRREFEMQKMKETETIRDFFDRLLFIVNKVRLLGEDLPDKRVVEKILVTLPERFESKISSLINWDIWRRFAKAKLICKKMKPKLQINNRRSNCL